MKKFNLFISYFFIIISSSLIPLFYNKSFTLKKLNLDKQKNTKKNSKSSNEDDKDDNDEDIEEDIIKDDYNKNKYKEYPYDGKEIEDLNSKIDNITSLIEQQQLEIKKKRNISCFIGNFIINSINNNNYL